LQTQISNISVDEGGGSPEARMFGDAQFVETMIELRRLEYGMRLAAEQRLDMIAEEMKSAKEEIASLRAQLRDAENDAKDLEARRLNDAEEHVCRDGYPRLAALVDRLQYGHVFPNGAGAQGAEGPRGRSHIRAPMWFRKY
jgi:hypothetical protein